MKLYLKSGQVIKMEKLHTIEILDVVYGVGGYYESNEHDKAIYTSEICKLCSQHKGNIIYFYYGDEGVFVTNTIEVVGVEV